MADQAEASDVSHGMASILLFADQLRGLSVQSSHRLNGSVDPSWLSFNILNRGRDHSGAERLCQNQGVAGLGASVGKNFLWMNQAGDSVPKLGFVVTNAMAADHGTSGLDHLRKTAGQYAFENCEISFLGEADQSERRQRPPTHGVNVAEGVGGGNMSESVRVVNDGRKKIDGLHQGLVGCDL